MIREGYSPKERKDVVGLLESVSSFFADTILGFIIVALVVITLFIYFVIRPIEAVGCRRTAELMQLEHHYSLMTSCMVKTRAGQWVPLDSYRAIEPAESK